MARRYRYGINLDRPSEDIASDLEEGLVLVLAKWHPRHAHRITPQLLREVVGRAVVLSANLPNGFQDPPGEWNELIADINVGEGWAPTVQRGYRAARIAAQILSDYATYANSLENHSLRPRVTRLFSSPQDQARFLERTESELRSVARTLAFEDAEDLVSGVITQGDLNSRRERNLADADASLGRVMEARGLERPLQREEPQVVINPPAEPTPSRPISRLERSRRSVFALQRNNPRRVIDRALRTELRQSARAQGFGRMRSRSMAKGHRVANRQIAENYGAPIHEKLHIVRPGRSFRQKIADVRSYPSRRREGIEQAITRAIDESRDYGALYQVALRERNRLRAALGLDAASLGTKEAASLEKFLKKYDGRLQLLVGDLVAGGFGASVTFDRRGNIERAVVHPVAAEAIREFMQELGPELTKFHRPQTFKSVESSIRWEITTVIRAASPALTGADATAIRKALTRDIEQLTKAVTSDSQSLDIARLTIHQLAETQVQAKQFETGFRVALDSNLDRAERAAERGMGLSRADQSEVRDLFRKLIPQRAHQVAMGELTPTEANVDLHVVMYGEIVTRRAKSYLNDRVERTIATFHERGLISRSEKRAIIQAFNNRINEVVAEVADTPGVVNVNADRVSFNRDAYFRTVFQAADRLGSEVDNDVRSGLEEDKQIRSQPIRATATVESSSSRLERHNAPSSQPAPSEHPTHGSRPPGKVYGRGVGSIDLARANSNAASVNGNSAEVSTVATPAGIGH